MAWYRRNIYTETKLSIKYMREKKTETGYEKLVISYENLKTTDGRTVSPPGVTHWVWRLLGRYWWALIILVDRLQDLLGWL